MEPLRGQSNVRVAERSRERRISEKHESDQHDDHDPGKRIGEDDAVPQPSIGRVAWFRQWAGCAFCDHRFLPGKMFRGERLVVLQAIRSSEAWLSSEDP
jgi:hypothetical protein